MKELDLFRRFRGGVAAPSEHARRRASQQLAASIEGEDRRGTRVLRLIRRRPGRAGLVLATVVVATGVALFASTPWQSSPGFLERAEAALTPPAGTVLHFRVVQVNSFGSSCTSKTPFEYWVDQAPPYTYRAFEVVNQPKACKAGTSIELGGEARKPTLMFRRPNALATIGRWPMPPTAPDWVVSLRQALGDGTARYAGSRVLDGRTVERIRIACSHAKFPICVPTYAYVDSDNLYPVRVEVEVAGGRFYQDFVTYEYLPGTPKNRDLADIRAQHPDATLVAREEQP